ncbi:putative F-box/LRR-repeat protein 22 [Silene latifolia]|uniref:putative F-box/LRR-repeat protein 22 n=1 Tax=Silene latifolia TaxID=37657 RepID=UPI003D782707
MVRSTSVNKPRLLLRSGLICGSVGVWSRGAVLTITGGKDYHRIILLEVRAVRGDVANGVTVVAPAFVGGRSSQLKRLRLANCEAIISEKALVQALKKLSSLEELELTICNFKNGEPVSIISACPAGITTFKFNSQCSRSRYQESDEEALAITASMPQLSHLQLIGNNMTNVGLTAILDACPDLQSLDLRVCHHLDLEGDLGKRLSEQIKDVRYPYDSTEDYKYPTTAYHSYDDEHDYYFPDFSDYDYYFDPNLPYDDDNLLLRRLYW